MIRGLTILSCGFAACIFWGSTVFAAPASLFRVAWSLGGAKPSSVSLDDRDAQYALKDSSGAQFEGKYDFARQAPTADLTLTAQFFDGSRAPIMLRTRPGLEIPLTVYHDPITSCSLSSLGQFEQPSRGDVETTLRKYFLAMRALDLTGPNGCGHAMRKRVVRAWFERSYELVTLKSYFRLNPAALAEYEKFEPTAAKFYLSQDLGVGFKLINDYKLELVNTGKVQEALNVNDYLLSSLKTNSDYARTIAQTQKVGVDRLEADRALVGASQ